MNYQEAHKILEPFIVESKTYGHGPVGLHRHYNGLTLVWHPKENPAWLRLEGDISMKQLEAVHWWIGYHSGPSAYN